MANPSWRHIGVDWDSGRWIAVGYADPGHPETAVFDTIDDLWRTHGTTAERIVADVPIGLCESHESSLGCVDEGSGLSRRCDDLARSVLGPRSSSVFTPPCREAARAAATDSPNYAEVTQTNKERVGKGLMRQAANIAPGIVEVEDTLLDDHESITVDPAKPKPTTLVEGHPEVCFRAFADGDLQYNKKTAPGMDERLTALARTPEYERGEWRHLAATLAEQGHDTGADDLLDALSLALTASAPEDEFHSLPRDPPRDTAGLPVQMVYRREEPFDVE